MQILPIKRNITQPNPCINSESDKLFESHELQKISSTLTRSNQGDLFGIGKVCIQAFKKFFVSRSISLVPVVEAAKEDKAPEKPPRMRYKDLPLYDSPHYEYKDYIEDKKKCPNANVKLLHQYLLPKVKVYRKAWVNSITEFCKDAKELKNDACKEACRKKEAFISYMRSPDNYMIRLAVVASGAASGYYAKSKSRSTLKRLFFTSLGALGTGSLCFPEKTDEIFREISFRVGKCVVNVLNCICGRSWELRDRVPCEDDMPAIPPDRPANERNQCEKKK